MIVGVIGKLGSGKTMILNEFGYQVAIRGGLVFSNFFTTYRSYKYEDPNFALHLPNRSDCVILGDEFYVYLDPREYSKSSNVNLTHLLMQLRKKGVTFIVSAPAFRLFDVRLREIFDYVIHAKDCYFLSGSSKAYVVTDFYTPLVMSNVSAYKKSGHSIIPIDGKDTYNTHETVGLLSGKYPTLTISEVLDTLQPQGEIYSERP